jgi:hypothetical protein
MLELQMKYNTFRKNLLKNSKNIHKDSLKLESKVAEVEAFFIMLPCSVAVGY